MVIKPAFPDASMEVVFGSTLDSSGRRSWHERLHSAAERYFLVTSNIKIPYWQAAAEGLEKASAQMKVRAEMVEMVRRARETTR